MGLFNTTEYRCPFCNKTVLIDTDAYPLSFEYKEQVMHDHLTKYHPIRSRLNRKVRKALKHGSNDNKDASQEDPRISA